MKKKKNLFRKLQKKRTTRNWMQYKHQRIKVKKLSERKKKIYVGKQVENAKNSEDLWKISKQTLGWEKRERIRKMKVGDELIEDKKKSLAI